MPLYKTVPRPEERSRASSPPGDLCDTWRRPICKWEACRWILAPVLPFDDHRIREAPPQRAMNRCEKTTGGRQDIARKITNPMKTTLGTGGRPERMFFRDKSKLTEFVKTIF